MKKLFCIMIVLCMIPIVAFSDADLKSMSFDELIALQKSITAEIMSRPEWKEIKVPAGQWKVGEDIPEGFYSLKSVSGYSSYTIWAKEVKNYSDMIDSGIINESDIIGKIELKAGWIVELNKPMIIAPAISLGF